MKGPVGRVLVVDDNRMNRLLLVLRLNSPLIIEGTCSTVEDVPRTAAAITLSPEQKVELRRRVRTPSIAQKDAVRARIVLRAAEGGNEPEIARRAWDVAADGGPVAVAVRASRSRRSRRSTAVGQAARDRQRRQCSWCWQRRWSRRPPASRTGAYAALPGRRGCRASTVHRIWRSHRLKPHRTRTFKYSRDPELVAKVVDIVGLYLDPPEGALVLCVDEKTQVQALDRTQPILPLRPGLPEGRTHDYKRNGTTNLYAALEIASGQVVTACQPAAPPPGVPRLLPPNRARASPTASCTSCSTTPPPTPPPRSSAGSPATSASTSTSPPPAPPG